MRFSHVLTESRCPCCELLSDSLCPHCREEIRSWQPRACLRCGAAADASCLCTDLPDAVATVASLWDYDGPAGDIVEMAKYHHDLWRLYALAREVRGWLRAQRRRAPAEAVVIPVPPSPRRLRQRGYDLPAILAGWADPWWSFRRGSGALRRIRDLDPQAGQGQQARMARMASALQARHAPPAVILLDDVLTTGATVAACSEALASAGAQWIGVLTLTRVAAYWAADEGQLAGTGGEEMATGRSHQSRLLRE